MELRLLPFRPNLQLMNPQKIKQVLVKGKNNMTTFTNAFPWVVPIYSSPTFLGADYILLVLASLKHDRLDDRSMHAWNVDARHSTNVCRSSRCWNASSGSDIVRTRGRKIKDLRLYVQWKLEIRHGIFLDTCIVYILQQDDVSTDQWCQKILQFILDNLWF